MNIRKSTFALMTYCAIQLSGCSSNQIAETSAIQQRAAHEASTATITPESAIADAENKLLEARTAGLGFYAPLHIAQAQDSIKQAREYLTKPPKNIQNAALMSAIAAQNFIEKGYSNKKNVEVSLHDSLAHKQILEELNAPSLLPEDYQEIVESLSALIKEIENGKVPEAIKNQTKLLEQMAEVEINTLNKIHLSEAEAYLDKAEDIDADDYAELTYENAEKTIAASTNFIRANYRDRKGVAKAGQEALWAGKQAYFVALEAKKLVKMDPAAAEKHALEVYSILNTVYRSANVNDLEPQRFYSAAETLVNMVNQLKSQTPQNIAPANGLPNSSLSSSNNLSSPPKIQSTALQARTTANQATLKVNQNDQIADSNVLPGFDDPRKADAPPLQADEQLFDQVENMQDKKQ